MNSQQKHLSELVATLLLYGYTKEIETENKGVTVTMWSKKNPERFVTIHDNNVASVSFSLIKNTLENVFNGYEKTKQILIKYESKIT